MRAPCRSSAAAVSAVCDAVAGPMTSISPSLSTRPTRTDPKRVE